MDDTANSLAPAPTLLTYLQNLITSRPPPGCEWGVFAYVTTADSIDNINNNTKALVFLLGSFATEKLAETHAKYIIQTTGYPKPVIAKYGLAIPITNVINTTIITNVPVDLKGTLIQMENEEYEKQKRLYQQKQKIEQNLLEEQERETDHTTQEFYNINMYKMLKQHILLLEHQKQCDKLAKQIIEQKQIIHNHIRDYPKHVDDFLPSLKSKLLARGEEDLFHTVNTNYQQYKSVLF